MNMYPYTPQQESDGKHTIDTFPTVPLATAKPKNTRPSAVKKREQILQAAIELISAHTVTEVSMDDIAHAAGVGKGTIFRHFTSRTGLLLALLDRDEKQFQIQYLYGNSTMGPNFPAFDRLVAFGEGRITFYEKHEQLLCAANATNRYENVVSALNFQHIKILMTKINPLVNSDITSSVLLSYLESNFLHYLKYSRNQSSADIRQGWIDLVTNITRTS